MSVIIELKLIELKRLLEIGPYCETDGASIHARRLFPLLSTDFIVDIIIESIYVIKKMQKNIYQKKIIDKRHPLEKELDHGYLAI